MSTFYGMIQGHRGAATRGGSRNSGFIATAQSFKGSVITNLDYEDENNLVIRLSLNEGSSTYGDTVFRGSMKELREIFEEYNKKKRGI